MKLSTVLKAFLLTAVVLLTSCRSKQTAEMQMYDNSIGASADWSTVYSNVSLTVERPMSLSTTARMTMENGKYVHMSMRFLGMEIAVVYIDNEMAYFVDKYHKYLFAEPLQQLLGEQYAGLTLADIQKIILGQQKLPVTENVDFSTYGIVDTPTGEVASALAFSVITDQGPVQGRMTWRPADAKWNEENRTVNFSVPSNYQQVSIDNVKEILKSMSY